MFPLNILTAQLLDIHKAQSNFIHGFYFNKYAQPSLMQHSSNFTVCIKTHLDCLWLMWSSSFDSFGLDRNRNVGQESPLLCSCFSLRCQHKVTWRLVDLAQHKCNSEMMSCCGAPTFLFLSVVGITSKWCMAGEGNGKSDVVPQLHSFALTVGCDCGTQCVTAEH